MVAEGFNASKCIFKTNERVGSKMPIAKTIYEILWQHMPVAEGFKNIENILI